MFYKFFINSYAQLIDSKQFSNEEIHHKIESEFIQLHFIQSISCFYENLLKTNIDTVSNSFYKQNETF